MGVQTLTVNDCLVWKDEDYLLGWLDIVGRDYSKYVSTFDHVPTVSADNLTGWTTTLVEAGGSDSTVAVGNAQGGTLVITTDANENDGAQIQMNGEAFKLTGAYPCYFGIKLQVDEATQTDFAVGLAITDTTLLGGASDGVYFRKVDGSTDVNLVIEKNSNESTTVVDTCVDDTYAVYEFYYDGTTVKAYIDNVLTATITVANETNWPDDEELTPSIAFLTGAAASQVMTVDWVRVMQAN